MKRFNRWTVHKLRQAAQSSTSVRQIIIKLGLVPAGGNYVQIQRALLYHKIDTSHFTGQGWRKDRTFAFAPRTSLDAILVKDGTFQSFKLKQRLFRDGIKTPRCELCGWAEMSADGRIPIELDHINGDRYDNRIENLRILCPNCHSLQGTHRGMNKKRRDGGMVDA